MMNKFLKGLGIAGTILGVTSMVHGIVSSIVEYKNRDKNLKKQCAYQAIADKYVSNGYTWDDKTASWVKPEQIK